MTSFEILLLIASFIGCLSFAAAMIIAVKIGNMLAILARKSEYINGITESIIHLRESIEKFSVDMDPEIESEIRSLKSDFVDLEARTDSRYKRIHAIAQGLGTHQRGASDPDEEEIEDTAALQAQTEAALQTQIPMPDNQNGGPARLRPLHRR